jgi:glycosyltransferase involved in cell wall biosynthesis
MKPVVSIVMPCYNAGKFISKALHSVGVQDHDNWELLAVDDVGPDDGTRLAVERFASEFPNNRVEWIRHETNRGVSAARNSAISQATGQYIALLDPDDYWLPSHLRVALDALDKHPEVAVFSSQAYLFNEDHMDAPYGIESYEDWEMDAFPAVLGIRNALPASSCVMRSCLFVQIGLFDEERGIQHAEDYDLWLRIAQSGNKFYFLREPTVYYRKHSLGATSDSGRMGTAQKALAEKHLQYIFVLQRGSLEHLCRNLKGLRIQQDKTLNELHDCQSRLRAMEEASERLRNNPVVRTLLKVRRRLLDISKA